MFLVLIPALYACVMEVGQNGARRFSALLRRIASPSGLVARAVSSYAWTILKEAGMKVQWMFRGATVIGLEKTWVYV